MVICQRIQHGRRKWRITIRHPTVW